MFNCYILILCNKNKQNKCVITIGKEFFIKNAPFNTKLSLDKPIFKTFFWIFSPHSNTKCYPEHDIYAAEHQLSLGRI